MSIRATLELSRILQELIEKSKAKDTKILKVDSIKEEPPKPKDALDQLADNNLFDEDDP